MERDIKEVKILSEMNSDLHSNKKKEGQGEEVSDNTLEILSYEDDNDYMV